MKIHNYLNHSIQILWVTIFLHTSFIFAQSSVSQNTATFMVLPLSTESSLASFRDNFTDRLLDGLKKGGFNAVGTRYLTATLQMDTCTSTSCMEKAANLVGARFVVYGKLDGDSVTFRLKVQLFDISSHTEFCSFERVLVGGSQALELFMPELIMQISEATRQTPTITETTKNFQQPAPLLDDPSKNRTDTIPSLHAPDSLPKVESHKMSGSGITQVTIQTLESIPTQGAADNNTLNRQNLHGESVPDSALSPLKISSPFSDTLQRNNQISAEDTQPPPVSIEAKPEINEQHPLEISSLIEKHSFKRGRIILSANLAAASFICGLVLNNQIRKSLLLENDTYTLYMHASRNETPSTYKKYIDQTNHTNRLSAGRGIMYGISVISIAGTVLSIYF